MNLSMTGCLEARTIWHVIDKDTRYVDLVLGVLWIRYLLGQLGKHEHIVALIICDSLVTRDNDRPIETLAVEVVCFVLGGRRPIHTTHTNAEQRPYCVHDTSRCLVIEECTHHTGRLSPV